MLNEHKLVHKEISEQETQNKMNFTSNDLKLALDTQSILKVECYSIITEDTL